MLLLLELVTVLIATPNRTVSHPNEWGPWATHGSVYLMYRYQNRRDRSFRVQRKSSNKQPLWFCAITSRKRTRNQDNVKGN